jgi:hypothetical protein
MRTWFMLHEGKHHRLDEGLYLHYPCTCNVHDALEIETAFSPWAPRETRMKDLRFAPSRLGLVVLCYETKGMMTFMVQLNSTRIAWQRIKWKPDFHENWDDPEVQKAMRRFIWVAESEEARQELPGRPGDC